MKKILILSGVFFLIVLGYFTLFEEKKEKNLEILTLESENEKLRDLIYEYGKKENINITIKETDFFNFRSSIEEKHSQNEKVSDVFIVLNDWIGDLVNKGILSEINEDNLTDLLPQAKKSVFYNEKYYAYPFLSETMFLFYNKEYISNPPETIDRIMELSKELKNKENVEGLVFPTSEFYYHYPWFRYFGGKRSALTDIKNLDLNILKTELDYVKSNFLYTDVFVADILFKEKKALMFLSGNWQIEKFKSLDFETSFISIKDKKFRPFIGFKTFGIYKNSENKDEANKLLKYLMSKEAQDILSEIDGLIPVNMKSLENSGKKVIKEFLAVKDNTELMPNSEKMMDFWTKSSILLGRALKKEEDNDTVIREVFRNEP